MGENNQIQMYELYAVIVHEGSIYGGHYYAYVNLTRNHNDKRWQRLVKRSTEEDDEHTLKCKVDSFFESASQQVPTKEKGNSESNKTVLTKVDSNWFYVSDNIIKKVSEDEVLSRNDAYILFYEAQ